MTTASKPELRISVFSDYICPFCFIGHKRLQSLRTDFDLKINWCFIEIHPETPLEGMPVDQLNYSADYWQLLMHNLQRLADEEQLNLAERRTTCNSRKALLLAEEARRLGAETFYALHERLFSAYFIDGGNIGDETLLRQLAADCGIGDDLIERAWSDPYTHGPATQTPARLLPYLQYAGTIRVSAVPTYVFNREILSGAVDRQTLLDTARRMSAN